MTVYLRDLYYSPPFSKGETHSIRNFGSLIIYLLVMAETTPQWYQEAVIYELHIRAFFDSNQDGRGDFRGLVQKLDYLQDLGVTAVWLLPFYPSPLKDDGYDIADYTDVHSSYGNLADFKLFLREAHQRNIRVITELVLNHTSDQHPWFQRARNAPPDSPWRNFYVWNDNAEKYSEARIIFKDFETSNWTWDPVAQAYYWHRFYSHQPDLNYDNPEVQKAAIEWLDFWMDLGVDGLRLDAVPYLFEREDTNCENLHETHQFLKKLRKHIDQKYPGRMFLAEANQWPEDARAYFGEGDECNMAFHFPLMPRLFMSLQMEDRSSLVDIMQQTPAIPENCQWCIFLRNHDELTLEMVTDEERDYMYRSYAKDPQARINQGIRRRLAPLLNNNRKKIELMNGLLFSFPGTPVIYYGDEIGMGDNFYLDDRNGVRTPMQWNSDRNAGFSQAHPQHLFLPINIDPEYHYESVNVETQQNNPESLLSWMKRIIALRKRYRALSLGTLNFLHPENSKILAYITQYKDEKILVIANLSRFTEYTELDLSEWQGSQLLELFGQNTFPTITDKPYLFTLAAHSFYWFSLTKPLQPEQTLASIENTIPTLTIPGNWDSILQKTEKDQLEALLPNYLITKRWFNRKSKKLKKAEITEIFSIESPKKSFILLVKTINLQEEEEIYFLPITFINEEKFAALQKEFPAAVLVHLPKQQGYLIDACYDPEFSNALIHGIERGAKLKGQHGVLISKHTAKFRLHYNQEAINHPKPLSGEQSNTSIAFGKNLILKCYRRCQSGAHPDLEMAQFLTEKSHFSHIPDLAGFLEYHDNQGNRTSLGLLQQYCPHQSDAWQYTLNTVQHFLKDRLTTKNSPKIQSLSLPTLDHFFKAETIPTPVQTLIGDYGPTARLLGERTAQMHISLASSSTNPDFSPEPFTTLYQRTLYQSIRGNLGRTLTQLRKILPALSPALQQEAQTILQSSSAIETCIQQIMQRKINAARIRVHGDFHLGQALFTGKDFIILDFEGEPDRPLSERRIKRSPLRDIAGMLRSFDYAAQTTLLGEPGAKHKVEIKTLQPWTTFWRLWASTYFLQGYFSTITTQKFLPEDTTDLNMLLQIHLIEKALYEIQYELNHRPHWLPIPCRGLLALLTF